MAKKDIKDKFKTQEERQVIKNNIIQELSKHQIDTLEGMQPFHKILDEYVKPNITSGFSGRLLIPELDRYIEYILPIRKQSENHYLE